MNTVIPDGYTTIDDMKHKVATEACLTDNAIGYAEWFADTLDTWTGEDLGTMSNIAEYWETQINPYLNNQDRTEWLTNPSNRPVWEEAIYEGVIGQHTDAPIPNIGLADELDLSASDLIKGGMTHELAKCVDHAMRYQLYNEASYQIDALAQIGIIHLIPDHIAERTILRDDMAAHILANTRGYGLSLSEGLDLTIDEMRLWIHDALTQQLGDVPNVLTPEDWINPVAMSERDLKLIKEVGYANAFQRDWEQPPRTDEPGIGPSLDWKAKQARDSLEGRGGGGGPFYAMNEHEPKKTETVNLDSSAR